MEHILSKYQCATCEKIVGLDDWQIADLPSEMLYEKEIK